MEHIQGFTWSHWIPPSVECLHRIAPTAAMVKEFKWNTQNTNKTQLWASNYGTFWSLVVCENFTPKTNPLLISLMQKASCKCEMPQFELKSLHTFLVIKRCQRAKIGKAIKLTWSSFKKWAHICAHRGWKAVKKNQMLAISMAMRMWQYNAGHITRWSTSWTFIWKALCAAFGQVPARYCPGGQDGHQNWSSN